jgi:hypothetical protein
MLMRRKTDCTAIRARMVAALAIAQTEMKPVNPECGAALAGPLSATAHACVAPLGPVPLAINRRTARNRDLT